MKILLTGFEPFGGSPINASEQLVRSVVEDPPPGFDLCTCILPVDRSGGTSRLRELLNDGTFEAVLCLGEANRALISIERVAVNLLDYRIPDNLGQQVQDEPVVPGGPAAYFATLPVRRIFEEIRQAGIPVELSLSAGTFLCNQAMYTLLHHLSESGQSIPAGFIHLPVLPEAAARSHRPQASMSVETTRRALEAVLGVLLLEA
jgi:pyroglutamyl-peptidase